jgi:ABC-type transport system substrate-binding protein
MFRYHGRIVAGMALLLVSSAGAQAQTLRVSNLNAPSGKGDPTTSLSYQHTYTFEAIFDTLTAVRGDGKPAASLAESWTNKDPLTWTFKLKPGVTFHTGTPLTADVIVFAVKNLQSDDQKKLGAPVYGSLSHIIEATKLDDMTIRKPGPTLGVRISGPGRRAPAPSASRRGTTPRRRWRGSTAASASQRSTTC